MYKGEFKNNKLQGTGKSEWFSNNKKLEAVYTGEYKGGCKEGFGEYREREGIVYKGRWRGGVAEGGVVVQGEGLDG